MWALGLHIRAQLIYARRNARKTQSEFIFNLKPWEIFVLIATRAENPHSQRYDVANGKITFKAFSDSSGYSCEACIQNWIKLTLACNIFSVVSLVSSMIWFNSDVDKFNESISAIFHGFIWAIRMATSEMPLKFCRFHCIIWKSLWAYYTLWSDLIINCDTCKSIAQILFIIPSYFSSSFFRRNRIWFTLRLWRRVIISVWFLVFF